METRPRWCQNAMQCLWSALRKTDEEKHHEELARLDSRPGRCEVPLKRRKWKEQFVQNIPSRHYRPYHGNFRRWRRTYQQRRCEAKITTVRALGIAWLGTWRRELREDERQTGLRLSGCKNNFFFRLRLRRLYNFLFPITFDCVRIRL